MALTKKEIVNQMVGEMPYQFLESSRPYIEEAMQIYATQEAKAYANWLANQVIAGRTSTKLWNDYKSQIVESV